MHLDPTTISRFWKYVTKSTDPDGCWHWAGTCDLAGYGRLNVNHRPHMAHRLSWIIHNGSIPDGMNVCHRCDNPPCVNPNHLFLGTQRDNIMDCFRKGRARRAKGADTGWYTHPDSMARGEANGRSKVTEEVVMAIRTRYAAGVGPRQLAREYGIHRETIRMIVARRTWTHLP